MPPLSVIATSCHPGPFFERALTEICRQAGEAGAEVIVATAAASLPGAPSGVRVLSLPGHTVLQLRSAGVLAAQGEIIAITEDHCLPLEGWCRGILQAHRDQPGLLAIGGAVLNGTPEPALAEANYLAGFAALMPPFTHPPRDRIPGVANMTLKRSALAPEIAQEGHLEYILHPRIYAEGRGGFDDRFAVKHYQYHGLWSTFRDHLHNGRCTSGLMHLEKNSPAWKEQIRHSRRLHRLLMQGVRTTLLQKNYPPAKAARALPWLAAVFACHCAGYWWGLHFGAGKSSRCLD